jgi:hypothetical protein
MFRFFKVRSCSPVRPSPLVHPSPRRGWPYLTNSIIKPTLSTLRSTRPPAIAHLTIILRPRILHSYWYVFFNNLSQSVDLTRSPSPHQHLTRPSSIPRFSLAFQRPTRWLRQRPHRCTRFGTHLTTLVPHRLVRFYRYSFIDTLLSFYTH